MTKFIKICFVFILIFACGCFGVKVYNSYTQPDYSSDIITTTPPDSYDLRDYIDIGVEHQYNFGICYAFASLTSLETYLALNYGEYYDFSELHFATSMYVQDNYYSSVLSALNNGGNFAHFTLYTQKDKSLVLEQKMPMSEYRSLDNYTLSTRLVNTFNNINSDFYPLVKVNDTKSYPQYVGNKNNYSATELENFRNEIKNHIMQYGAVTAGIYTGSSFSNTTINYRITNDSLVTDQSTINDNINHLVSIVGWNDNYDANGTWENKGAYICLNSWGTSFGANGYFYVSYDDYFIESTIQGVTNATLSTTNTKISTISEYQNKTSIFTHSYSESYPTTYTANIINTSNNIGENITFIDSYIKGGTTKFYVKFFNTKAEALAGINSVSTLVSAIKIDDYTLSTKYKLSTPLAITGNYMVVVREVKETHKYHSLGANTSDNIGIEPCYSYQGGHIGDFDIATDIWDPGVTGRALDCTLPIILHTDKTYVEVSPFESEVYSIINNKYVKNNATFINKTLKLKLNNANITSTNLSNISITKLTTGTNIAPYFEFEFNNNILTIAMINNLSGNFTGDYLVTIPCADTTIYRLIEIQDVATFTITYHLDGGTASNPDVYTNKQTSLSLNNPIKPGFTFVGWYTDSNFTLSFNPNSLPYTNLVLYAKYDFASPAVVNKSNDISITYYKDLEITISILATHHLLNDYNTLTYQWYKSATANGTFTIIDQANTPSLTLNAVNQSGYYACEITVIIMDTSMVSTPCTKTLSIGPSNTISVNIKPYIYDMSNVKWNYTEAFSYDTTIHSVELINLPSGITATYTNNSSSEINTYTAHATLVYDDMEGNAFANNIEDLTWEIRKAQITITINDIYSTEHLSQDILNSTYSCHIDNEYLPSGIIDLEDKIAYLNLQYSLQSTSNDCSKIISATTNSFDIYNISIINGEYRVVVHTLTNNDIIATNNKGFVQNCTFNATTHNATSDTKQLLKDKDLTLVDAYDFNFSYLKDDEASITIPIDRAELLNGLSVYMLKNGELIKVDTTISSQGLIFNTIEQEATYLIVKNNIINSNNDMIILTVIISIYIGLFICAIINTIKHKHNYY